MVKRTKKKTNKALDLGAAFKYPFNRPMGLLNILWILVPIIGWFALMGYSVRIVKNFVKGNFKELPLFNFSKDLNLGFFMFLKAIPFVIVIAVANFVLAIMPVIGTVASLFISFFVVPILSVNFFVKETIDSYFEFDIIKHVFNNFGDYIIVILKSLVLGITFLILFIVLVGIPANAFTKNIFFADFYRRYVK
jgi:hypothetical protein|tara:strand:- start:1532 stop:2110 length:579 start_codon:yes stop_codon:yes gene_type:complete